MATDRPDVFYTSELGGNMCVRALTFKGQTGVDIRKWEMTYPTKIGIRLTTQNWARLVQETDDNGLKILCGDNSSVEERIDVGRGVYISRSANMSYIHIRQWYLDKDNVEKPGKKGLCMQLMQFKELMAKKEEIHQSLPKTICYLDDDHQNQMGYFRCSDCNPFGYQNDT